SLGVWAPGVLCSCNGENDVLCALRCDDCGIHRRHVRPDVSQRLRDRPHIWFRQTRIWMALIMGAVMAVIIVGLVWTMYEDKRANIAIVVGGGVVFAAALWLVRSQQTVGDISYMKAMIPHHSIAILTSERAHIRDPRVRKLADGIIEAQVREIGEM